MAGQPGLFDADERLAAVSAAGVPLERLNGVVDFEQFRPELDAALSRWERAKGGLPPYDAALMFQVLVLHTLYSLADDATASATAHAHARPFTRLFKVSN